MHCSKCLKFYSFFVTSILKKTFYISTDVRLIFYMTENFNMINIKLNKKKTYNISFFSSSENIILLLLLCFWCNWVPANRELWEEYVLVKKMFFATMKCMHAERKNVVLFWTMSLQFTNNCNCKEILYEQFHFLNLLPIQRETWNVVFVVKLGNNSIILQENEIQLLINRVIYSLLYATSDHYIYFMHKQE